MDCSMPVGSLGDAMGSALAGMRSGVGRVQAAATSLATEISPDAIVEMKVGARQHEVNTKVAKVVDELLGDLIDTLA